MSDEQIELTEDHLDQRERMGLTRFPEPPADVRNIQQRLWAAQEHCDYVQKDQEKADKEKGTEGQAFSTMSHEGATQFTKPFLHKQRILAMHKVIESRQDGNRHWARVETRFINIDNPKDFEPCITEASFVNNQGHGPSSCLSLCVKQALLKTLMVATGEKETVELVEYEPDRPPKSEAESQKSELYDDLKFYIKESDLDQKKVTAYCVKMWGKIAHELNADYLDILIDTVKENKNNDFSLNIHTDEEE